MGSGRRGSVIGLSDDPSGGIVEDEGDIPEVTGYETADYRLVTSINAAGIRVYQVRNKAYGVTEYEDHLLHRILSLMQSMQMDLHKAVKSYVPPLNVVEISNEEEREPSLH